MFRPEGSWPEILVQGGTMLDTALLASIARQMMSSNTVDVEGMHVPVRRTSRHQLRMLAFSMDGREYQAVEQSAEKPSRWGQLAPGGASGCAVQGRGIQQVRGGGG